jgi:hypothetical protein
MSVEDEVIRLRTYRGFRDDLGNATRGIYLAAGGGQVARGRLVTARAGLAELLGLPHGEQLEFVESAIQLARFVEQHFAAAVDEPEHRAEPSPRPAGPPRRPEEPRESVAGLSPADARAIAGRRPGVQVPVAHNPRTVEEIREWFWSVVNVPGYHKDTCWEWTGPVDGRAGGQVRRLSIRRSAFSSHRLAWAYVNGPIPADVRIYHTCLNPACCRPSHLYPKKLISTGLSQPRVTSNGTPESIHAVAGVINGAVGGTARETMPDLMIADLRSRWSRREFASVDAAADEYGISRSYCGKILRGKARVAASGARPIKMPPHKVAELYDRWDRGRYVSKAAAARAYGISTRYVSTLLRRKDNGGAAGVAVQI